MIDYNEPRGVNPASYINTTWLMPDVERAFRLLNKGHKIATIALKMGVPQKELDAMFKRNLDAVVPREKP